MLITKSKFTALAGFQSRKLGKKELKKLKKRKLKRIENNVLKEHRIFLRLWNVLKVLIIVINNNFQESIAKLLFPRYGKCFLSTTTGEDKKKQLTDHRKILHEEDKRISIVLVFSSKNDFSEFPCFLIYGNDQLVKCWYLSSSDFIWREQWRSLHHGTVQVADIPCHSQNVVSLAKELSQVHKNYENITEYFHFKMETNIFTIQQGNIHKAKRILLFPFFFSIRMQLIFFTRCFTFRW